MKKVVLLAFVLVLSSMSMFGTQLVITVSGSIHHVYSGESIQEAINSAASGDTIFVHNGTYYEHVVVNKLISLIGENRSTTVIDGNGTGNVIHITAHFVNVAGFTIRNGTNGIFTDVFDFNTISGNIVTDNQNGIHLFASCLCNSAHDNTIRNNTIKNNGFGISLGVAAIDNSIYHNNFINNTQQVDTHGSTNVWDDDYPSGGNYWSNYTGVDLYYGPYQNETGNDGIGDAPHILDADNQDKYPLMNPWFPREEEEVEEEEEVPFWTQWWFWTIVIAGILALAGAVYFLKKRKPPTPTAPPLPPEGTTQNINPLNS